MAGSIAKLRSSARALLGEWAGDRAGPLPSLPEGLPPAVQPIAAGAVALLADYQGIEHARLYLHRLRRFVGKPGFDEAKFVRIAVLLAERMSPEDPIRIAQLVLGAPNPAASSRGYDYKLSELVSVLPADFGGPILDLFDWIGLSRRKLTRTFNAMTAAGRLRLRIEAGLRRWRGLSVSYASERAWVERWLHMIDRAAAKQPAAVEAVIETATMVRGCGETYRQGLADWHALIDGLVKPVFDGRLLLPDLASAISQVRDAAMPDPRQANLKRTIAAIRTSASADASGPDACNRFREMP